MIRVEGLCKTFKVPKRPAGIKAAAKALFKREYIEIEALREVSFNITAGEVVGYIGPNGAGKSTTIKVMSGILVPDKGKCEILGRTPWDDRIAHVKDIGVVFGQRSQLMWDIPVIDSFELLRDIYRVPDNQYRVNLSKLRDILDLGDILENPVRQLSLGQRMRCEIAASLLHNPKILFLDEPTIGLDAVSKIAVRRFIKDINRENGVTVILTTHDMGDVEALTDRILLIGKGEILFDGSFNKLKSSYNSYSILTVDHSGCDNAPTIANTSMLSNINGRMVLQVDTKHRSISSVINQLSDILEIRDISVETRPIEEIIAALYKEYHI
ncbi:MAG: ATP-binding cassette domain-containing protein [Clostridiales bacterium]|nr:ATP-binding cassette domain-containing protein [Clostridiales bacterium]